MDSLIAIARNLNLAPGAAQSLKRRFYPQDTPVRADPFLQYQRGREFGQEAYKEFKIMFEKVLYELSRDVYPDSLKKRVMANLLRQIDACPTGVIACLQKAYRRLTMPQTLVHWLEDCRKNLVDTFAEIYIQEMTEKEKANPPAGWTQRDVERYWAGLSVHARTEFTLTAHHAYHFNLSDAAGIAKIHDGYRRQLKIDGVVESRLSQYLESHYTSACIVNNVATQFASLLVFLKGKDLNMPAHYSDLCETLAPLLEEEMVTLDDVIDETEAGERQLSPLFFKNLSFFAHLYLLSKGVVRDNFRQSIVHIFAEVEALIKSLDVDKPESIKLLDCLNLLNLSKSHITEAIARLKPQVIAPEAFDTL